MNVCRVWLLLLLCCAGALPAAEQLTYRFTAVGDSESVPEGVVNALAQDAQGRVWIGTRGLVRYDGYEFLTHLADPTRADAPGGNFVRSLLLAGDGRLWVGYDGGVVSVYDPSSGGFRSYSLTGLGRASAGGIAVSSLAEGPDGAILIGTRGAGVFRLDPRSGELQGRQEAAPGTSPKPADVVFALAVAPDGGVWIGSADGLRHWPAPTLPISTLWRLPGAQDNVEVDAIYSLALDGEKLWIGSLAGRVAIRRLDDGAMTLLPHDARHPVGVHDTVYDIEVVSEDEVWLMRAGGIEVRSRQGEILGWQGPDLTRPAGLRGSDVRAVMRTADGLIWVGGFGGGVQWHDPAARWLDLKTGEPGHGAVFEQPNVASVLQRRNGEVWVGTRGSGVAVLGADLRLRAGIPPTDALPVAWVTALAEDQDGRMWLGSRDGLYMQLPGGGFERLGAERGLTATALRRLHFDRAGVLWIGSNNGLFRADLSVQPLQITRLALSDGRALGGDINAFAETAAGELWVGGNAGLFRVEGDALQSVDLGLGAAAIVGLLVDQAGNLWADSTNGLRRRLPNGVVDTPAALARLTGDFGANLLEDEQGRLWSQRYVWDPKAGQLHPMPRDALDALGSGWFRAYAGLRDGRLLFGGSRGLLVVKPDHFRPQTTAPQVSLSALRVGERTLPVSSDRLVLAPGERSLSVQFAALDYRRPGSLRYGFRLQGVDADWLDVDASQRSAAYRNLLPGRYQLEIRAAGSDGVYGETLRVPVTVQPPWWMTWWARTAAVLGLLAAIVAVFRVRTLQLRRQAWALERKVAERTAELEAANRALAAAAVTDSLTKLLNRRGFLGRLQDPDWPTGALLMLCDIDHFKRINDTWGHDVGDAVLIEVAARLSAVLKPEDVLARWGGEEFVVYLSGPEAAARAASLRAAVGATALHLEPGPPRVTLSAGAASVTEGPDLDHRLKRADERLYRAKQSGRDRLVVED